MNDCIFSILSKIVVGSFKKGEINKMLTTNENLLFLPINRLIFPQGKLSIIFPEEWGVKFANFPWGQPLVRSRAYFFLKL